MGNSRFGLRTRLGLISNVIVAPSFVDADAQAFITAAGITDATQQTGIHNLVLDLKSYGIWTKMKALYPFVGGTASTHKWNLKDPRDLNDAFRLVFVGGVTHSSTGVTPNGTNGYADTKLNGAVNLTQINSHLSIYVRINIKSSQPYDIGSSTDAGANTNPTFLITRYNNNLAYLGIADPSYGASIASTDSRGFWAGGTNGSLGQTLYKNGSSIKTSTATSGIFANQNLYIGANNGGGTATLFSNKEYAFASIGDGLSSTEAANFYTAVQAFQTTLGRQV